MSDNFQSASTQSNKTDSNDLRRLQLLIVDDDDVQRTAISQIAKQAGHSITLAQSCTEAIEKVRTLPFDCMTLDLTLGDGDGLEVLNAMVDARFAGSVILITGANAVRRTAVRSCARSSGMELQSLPKPVDLAALRVCLANLRQTAKGLPIMHSWGGVAVDQVTDEHRSRTQMVASARSGR